MLVTLSPDLDASLAQVAASLYYLLYGPMQSLWGMHSDRLGLVRVMPPDALRGARVRPRLGARRAPWVSWTGSHAAATPANRGDCPSLW